MAIVSACIKYYSKNFDSCVPPTPNDLFSVILPRDKTYDIGLDQSSSCTGIAIRSIDGDLEMIVDVRNNSFNKNTFYRELKGVLRKLVNGRNIRLVVCEDPIPAKGKKYASTVLLELRGQISAWMEEIPEFNQASFNSLYPQSWKSLIVDKSKGKHRSNDKECIASDICDIVPRFRKYKNIYASKDYDAFDAFGILLGYIRYAYTEAGVPKICGKIEKRHRAFVGYRYVPITDIQDGTLNKFFGETLSLFNPQYREYNTRYSKYENIRMATSNLDCSFTIMPDKVLDSLKWEYDLEPQSDHVLVAYMFNMSHYPQATRTALKYGFEMKEEVA